jgi:SAM-dependent methyltransferase
MSPTERVNFIVNASSSACLAILGLLEQERKMEPQLAHGNWVRKKNLLTLGLCTLGAGALILLPFGSLYRLLVMILFAVVLTSFLFPLYAYIMFSQKGGGFQEKIYTLLIRRLGIPVQGCILDIGSGNGVLAVKLAQRYSKVQVVGIDHWGTDWEYSINVCEKNARLAMVENRAHFQRGDAAMLDFDTETFDGAISNLTFHEVKSVPDKKSVVQEALRVVKPGGVFAFIDYFYERNYYGEIAGLENFLKDLRLTHFECQPLQDMISMPTLLKHPKILGRVGVIYGRK